MAKNNKGFTLIEGLIAIFFLLMVTAGIFGVLKQATSSTQASKDKLVAAYLAQEGIEIVRNLRDSNWVKYKGDLTKWLIGLPEGVYEAQYDSLTLSAYSGSGRYLASTTAGFYLYDTLGQSTKFKRKIEISYDQPANPIVVTVTVTVSWSARGKDSEIKAVETLYNWFE